MKDATILKTGIVGSVVAALCCATPVLVVALGAAGLTTWLGRVDDVLMPMLAVFSAMAAYGLWRRQHITACCADEMQNTKEST